jgi:hypothetical protein
LNLGDDEKLAKESMEKIFNILESNAWQISPSVL